MSDCATSISYRVNSPDGYRARRVRPVKIEVSEDGRQLVADLGIDLYPDGSSGDVIKIGGDQADHIA